jgi:hypothetical protein
MAQMQLIQLLIRYYVKRTGSNDLFLTSPFVKKNRW